MTPWDFITSPTVPSTVQVLALIAWPQGSLTLENLPSVQAGIPPGVLTWTGPPNIDPSSSLATREAEVVFGPLILGMAAATFQGLAIVDWSGSPTILALAGLGIQVDLANDGSTALVSGPVVVVKQGV
jgi:hypothetical protein